MAPSRAFSLFLLINFSFFPFAVFFSLGLINRWCRVVVVPKDARRSCSDTRGVRDGCPCRFRCTHGGEGAQSASRSLSGKPPPKFVVCHATSFVCSRMRVRFSHLCDLRAIENGGGRAGRLPMPQIATIHQEGQGINRHAAPTEGNLQDLSLPH